jgi:hypothetical protein
MQVKGFNKRLNNYMHGQTESMLNFRYERETIYDFNRTYINSTTSFLYQMNRLDANKEAIARIRMLLDIADKQAEQCKHAESDFDEPLGVDRETAALNAIDETTAKDSTCHWKLGSPVRKVNNAQEYARIQEIPEFELHLRRFLHDLTPTDCPPPGLTIKVSISRLSPITVLQSLLICGSYLQLTAFQALHLHYQCIDCTVQQSISRTASLRLRHHQP